MDQQFNRSQLQVATVPIALLSFLGGLMALIGIFVGDGVTLIALGVAAVFGAGVLGVAMTRRS